MLGQLLEWLFSFGRYRAQAKREKTIILSDEIDKLADLMDEVLKVTMPDGSVQENRLLELEHLRRRVWNRWIMILNNGGSGHLNQRVVKELEGCVKIAHAAPGAYVEELYLIQAGLADGHINLEIRQRFSRSIDRLRDVATKMRLNA